MSDWNETHRAVLEQHAEIYEHMTQRAPLIEQRLAAIRAALSALASCDVCEYEFEDGDRKHNVVCSQCWPHEVASRLYQLALAEKDAQIAAWRKTCLCGDAERCLRQTPAPPQEKR